MKIAFSFKYFTASMIFLIVIVLIALFVESGFIRNHFGDILIVLFIYCLMRIFLRNRLKFLWLYIFAFAVLVEIMQYFGLVYMIGLGHSQIARVVIGVTFDWWDIVMYFLGCVVVNLYELRESKKLDKLS
ncbi:MAG: DUF2809 domain-containing protein [Defluviitaleaceae bacterium]|nr:DUF2809 domain-containing protein [Defluviitaleaceae bacterium]